MFIEELKTGIGIRGSFVFRHQTPGEAILIFSRLSYDILLSKIIRAIKFLR